MRLNQDLIQRMFDGRGGVAGGGSSLDPGLINGLATEMWTEENYVSKTFFNELFVVHKKTTTTVYDGDTVVSTTVDTSGTFAPNEIPSQEESTDEETGYRTVVVTEVDNIEAKKGLWTDFFLSALGLNGSGGGGGIGDVTWQALGDNTDTRQIASSHLTTALGSALAGYATQSWVTSQNYITSSAISDMATKTWVNNQSFVNWTALGDTTTTQQIALSHLTTALSGYATQTWVTNNFSTPASVATQMQTYAKIQNGTITIGDTSITPITSVTGTFWGKSFTNGGTVNGTIKAGSNGGAIEQFHSVEMNSAGTLAGYGGFIDFHYYATGSTFDSTLDYTSRIIESEVGVISILAKNNNATNANKLAGLLVGDGYDGSYVQIGNIRIVYDSTNNALKVVKLVSDSEVAANFYATGSVSALGYGSGGGGGTGDVTWTNLADNSDTRQIALSHLTGALSGYATTSQLAGYLPLTGGQLNSGSNGDTLKLYSSAAYTAIVWQNAATSVDTWATGIDASTNNFYFWNNYLRAHAVDISRAGVISAKGLSITNAANNFVSFDNNATGAAANWMYFKVDGTNKASVGYFNNFACLANENTYARIGVADDGTPEYWPNGAGTTKYTLLHTGNAASYNIGSATKLQTARNLWGNSFDGTADVSGNIRILSTGSNYVEGIRMHVATNGWCGIVMAGSDNTGTTGTSAKTWSISNNDGTLWINKNGSDTNTGWQLCNVNGNWGIGTNNPTYLLNVAGTVGISGMLTAAGGITIGSAVLSWDSTNTWLNISNNVELSAGKYILAGTRALGQTTAGNYLSAGGGYGKNAGRYGLKVLACDQPDCQTGLGQDLDPNTNGYDLCIVGSNRPSYDHGYISFVSHQADDNTYRALANFEDNAGVVNFTVRGKITTNKGIIEINSGSVGDGLQIFSETTYSCVYYRIPSGNSTTSWSAGADADGFYFYHRGFCARVGNTGQLTLGAPQGTAPFSLSSTTLNTNLNADLLDGQHGSYYAAATSLNSYLPLTAGSSTPLTGALYINTTSGDIVDLKTSGAYCCISYKATSSTQWSVGCNTSEQFYFWNNNLNAIAVYISKAGQIVSNVATGTAPFDITSTTVCTNLNAELLDGQHSSYFATASSVTTLQGYFTNGSANTAIKLLTARTLWGQSFDGSANVSGDMSSVGNVSMDAGKNVCIGTAGGAGTNSHKGYFSAGPGYSVNSGRYGLRILVCDQSDAQTGLGQDLVQGSGWTNAYNLCVAGGNSPSDYGYISFVSHKVNNTSYRYLGGFYDNAGTIAFRVMGTLTTSGSATIGGSVVSGTSGGAIEGFQSWELNTHNTAGTNIGGFLDFHYNGTAQDYSVRLIEKDYSGVLQILAKDTGTGNAQRAGLIVGEGTYTSFIQIGNGRIVWNDSDHALRIMDKDGNACNLYATGGISALGYQSGGGGGGSTGVFSTSITPDTTGVYDLGTSTYKWRNLYLAGANGGNGFSIITSYSSYVYIGSLNKILFGADVEFEDTAYVENRMGIGVKNGNYDLYVYGENEGNAYFAGNVSVASLTNRSDMRLKDVVGDVNLSVQQIASAPTFKFKFKEKAKRTMVGTSAQYWDAVLPESVTRDADGILGLDYGVTALVSTIILAKGMTEHERRITKLEMENAELRARIKDLEEN